MDEIVAKRNEIFAAQVIKGLAGRNMTGYYAADKEEALKTALSLIEEGNSVAMGGCRSAHQIGLVEALKNGNYDYIDRDAAPVKREAELRAYDADVFLASPNAMSKDGDLVFIDGNSNRVSAIAYGPRKVILIVSMDKICADLDSAMKRARNVAAPENALRLQTGAPCNKIGSCADCRVPQTICCQFLVTRYSRHEGRIHVILVNEPLGF